MASPVNIVYLDVDDEITSAAARIRAAEEVRVALVLPAGSRLATSRINFRLLAREAQGRSRQLLIVAPEGATRALAASAGLSVFATVRELEESFAPPPDDAAEPDAGPAGAGGVAGAAAIGGVAAGAAASETVAAGPPKARARTPPASKAPPEPSPTVVTPVPVVQPADVAKGADAGRSTTPVVAPGRSLGGRSAGASLPVVAADRGRGGHRTAWLVGGIVFLFIALVGGVLGYLFLPAATIVVTPKVEAVGPLTFTVRADPTATDSDVAAGVVPATVQTFPLEATGDFQSTGKKISETKAGGTVTFSNVDPFAQHTIPSGSVVRTSAGVGFVSQSVLILNQATIVTQGGKLVIVPTTGDVQVRAVGAGTGGNVAANTIKVVPSSQNSAKIKVTNKAPTTGGTHTESPVVVQKDIDRATASLTKDLNAQLDAAIADPSQVLPGFTVFPTTKSLTAPVPTTDPSTIVGQPVTTFTYGLTATGSVTAVDTTAVEDLASQRLRTSVAADHDLVQDSIQVTVGKGRVQGASIVFPVRATASQVRRLDANELRDEVRGHSEADAQAILGQYGDVTIDLWPGFVDRIPVYDSRIDLTIKSPVPVETASPSPGDSGSGEPVSPTDTSSPGDSSSGPLAPSATDGGASPAP